MSGQKAASERYILVGNGLSAQVLAHCFEDHDIPFTIIGNSELSSSSRVAAGIWNPVVFKRLTKSWMAEELIQELVRFYRACESKMKRTFLVQRTLIKPFTEDQEKQLWIKKSRNELFAFLNPEVINEPNRNFNSLLMPGGYGTVEQSGNLKISEFLEAGQSHFSDRLWKETFDYKEIKMEGDKLSYKSLRARGIIFCEGYLVKNNPYFSWIPLKPAKGELLHLEIPELKLNNCIFNRNGFLMDQGNSTYLCGATYNWNDLNDSVSQEGLEELKQKLNKMVSCSYRIQKHLAGVRPSSIDRRPILGAHPAHQNLFVFNGLGAKGVMLAPYFAGKFVHFLKNTGPLPSEVDVRRFYHLYAT